MLLFVFVFAHTLQIKLWLAGQKFPMATMGESSVWVWHIEACTHAEWKWGCDPVRIQDSRTTNQCICPDGWLQRILHSLTVVCTDSLRARGQWVKGPLISCLIDLCFFALNLQGLTTGKAVQQALNTTLTYYCLRLFMAIVLPQRVDILYLGLCLCLPVQYFFFFQDLLYERFCLSSLNPYSHLKATEHINLSMVREVLFHSTADLNNYLYYCLN